MYRGGNCDPYLALPNTEVIHSPIFTEHDEEYLIECLDNLLVKHVDLISLYKWTKLFLVQNKYFFSKRWQYDKKKLPCN